MKSHLSIAATTSACLLFLPAWVPARAQTEASGSNDEIADPTSFAERLTGDLAKLAHDKHLYVDPPLIRSQAPPPSDRPPPPPSEGGVTRADRSPYPTHEARAPTGKARVSSPISRRQARMRSRPQ